MATTTHTTSHPSACLTATPARVPQLPATRKTETTSPTPAQLSQPLLLAVGFTQANHTRTPHANIRLSISCLLSAPMQRSTPSMPTTTPGTPSTTNCTRTDNNSRSAAAPATQPTSHNPAPDNDQPNQPANHPPAQPS